MLNSSDGQGRLGTPRQEPITYQHDDDEDKGETEEGEAVEEDGDHWQPHSFKNNVTAIHVKKAVTSSQNILIAVSLR